MADRSADSAGGSLLADLNPAQREAALAVVGPVCILAGPGTGKTHTITRRIAYGVRTGVYAPDRVLALTFTNRAAGQLRGRLGALGASAVQSRTFHSAALRQLSFFWPQAVGGAFPGIVSGKSAIIAEAAGRAGVRLGPQQLRKVAEQLEWRKVTEHTLDQFGEELASGRRPNETGLPTEQLHELAVQYERAKESRQQLDFEDVLLATAGMLESEPWITSQVRSQYRFFVVDEYQDISPLQHKLLRLWLGNRRELCVVGDPAQTIYSFAGANADYLTGFASEFADARVIRVDGSYRSSPPIIAAANELARHIPHAIQLDPLRVHTGRYPQPDVATFDFDEAEAAGIAERIRRDLESGVAPAEVAILVRTNAQVGLLERALEAADVPFRLAGGQPFFRRPEVRAVLAGLHAAVVSGQDAGPLFQTVSNVLRSRGWQQQRPSEAGPLREAWGAMDAIMRLADAAPAGTTLAEFSEQLEARAAHQFELTIDAVTISTMHAAKGLEWDHVYVAGLREGLLPTAAAADEPALVEEERRLFYVAITRARDRLHLSHSRAQPASRFLQELGNRIRAETPPPPRRGA